MDVLSAGLGLVGGLGVRGAAALGLGRLRYVERFLTVAQVGALRATPATIIDAPGAGLVVVPLFGLLLLDYTTPAWTESAANLALKYVNGSGTQISETIECTGFIDQSADTLTTIRPKQDGIVAKTAGENKAVVLHQLGAAEFGNSGQSRLRVQLWFTTLQTGW